MSTKTHTPAKGVELRNQAEELLEQKTAAGAPPQSAADTLRLVHELQVHQIELELQNEELISARNDLESALDRYTELYDFAPTGYFLLGPDGVILKVNHAGARLLGNQREHVTGRRFHLFIANVYRAPFDVFLGNIFAKGGIESCEIELLGEGGATTPVEVEARSTGRYQECSLVVFDLSRHRRAEKETMKLQAQLSQSQKLDSIGRLAGGVAHDFNNMLCGMMLQLNLLEGIAGLDQEVREGLGELKAGAVRASNLTRQLLLYSRRAHLQMSPLQLSEVVQHLLQMLRRVVGENYRLEFNAETDQPLVFADVGSVEQVVLNLVVNARDSMAGGGTIHIRTSGFEGAPSELARHPRCLPGTYVCIEVSDTGCGIPPQDLGMIFEPFYTTKGVGKGTGLGLSTVDGILAQHKGWVEVESALGKGSVFRVYFPFLGTGELVAKTCVAAAAAQRGQETILLVEDELLLRTIARRNLEQLGYRILEACDANEAQVIWEQKGDSVDLLLTDMVMPVGLSGLELAHRLMKARPELSVIVMSGYSIDFSKTEPAVWAGIEFLQKPFGTAALTTAIRKCLSQKVRA